MMGDDLGRNGSPRDSEQELADGASGGGGGVSRGRRRCHPRFSFNERIFFYFGEFMHAFMHGLFFFCLCVRCEV